MKNILYEMRCIILSLLCLLFSTSYAQVKYEKESRLKSTKVPKKAHDFIDVDLEIKQLKWYKEESFEGVSIEAKFKVDKKKYSVEFDTLGQLEDVEIEIEESEIPELVLIQINKTLSEECKRFKVLKIQKQLKGNINSLIGIKDLNGMSYLSGYELVIKGICSEGVSLYEYFFNEKGVLNSNKKIILNSTEHLEY